MTLSLSRRLVKEAQSRLTAEDIRALRDVVAQQRENARMRELRKRNRFSRNRRDRVTEAKAALMAVLGAGGAVGGMYAGNKVSDDGRGAAIGLLGGGLAGLVAGDILGGMAGNRKADRMERIELDTGVRVNEQQKGGVANAVGDISLADLIGSIQGADAGGQVPAGGTNAAAGNP